MLKFRLILLYIFLLSLGACTDNSESIKVLTADAAQYSGEKDDRSKTACLAWSLNKDEVRTVLSHAKPFTSGADLHLYDIFPCSISGKAVIKGTEVIYNLNSGGLIRLYNDGQLENFDWVGCVEPTCFSFFLHQERGLD